jgi:hypothetical protein
VTGLETALGLQAQKELAGGFVVSWSPLKMLGDDMYVLKPAVKGIAREYCAGTTQVVANIYHLGRLANGEGAGKT